MSTALSSANLGARLLAQLSAPSYKPPTLPSAAMELLRVAQQPRTSYRDVTALLEKDAMLAGRIMSIVQAPLYAGAHKIDSLPQALSRLGMNTLRDIVFQVSMEMTVFKDRTYSGITQRLRRHSVATAHLARQLCGFVKVEADNAFLAGLLHDVGIAAALIAISQASGKRAASPSFVSLWSGLEPIHARATLLVASRWGLSKAIRDALCDHHAVDENADPLAAVVTVADSFANICGYGLIPQRAVRIQGLTSMEREHLVQLGGDQSEPAALARARALLGVGEEETAAMLDYAERLPELVTL